MYGLTDLKTNTKIELDGEPYVVQSYQHSKLGRGGAVARTRLRNLRTGAVVTKTFRGNDKITPARLTTSEGQFLFADQNIYTFMDTSSFEQVAIDRRVIGEQAQWLKEGLSVILLSFKDQVIAVELPLKVTYKVTETDPGLKGDTVTGGSKQATLESGAKLSIPLFVQIGDKVRVDTRHGRYIERR